MIWYSVTEDPSIPDWLKQGLQSNCTYCGKPMLSGHNDFGRITGLRCSDMNCPSMIASRIVFIFELLSVKGYGFAKAFAMVKQYQWKQAIECLQVLEEPPTVSLGTYLRCNCIQGIDGEWESMVEKSDSYTLDELYKAYPDNEYLVANKQLLYDNLKYVRLRERTIRKSKSMVPITIMITGTPIGFATKESFISACNAYCKGEYKIIHQKTAKASGVNFLIREPGSTTRVKVEVATKANIPIVTSKEFLQILSILMKEVTGDEDSGVRSELLQ